MSTSASSYAIDPVHSNVDFVVRHSGISNIRGTFTGVAGTVEVGADDRPVAIDVNIDAKTLATQVAPRDKHVTGPDMLDVEKFPTITFVSTSVSPKGSNDFSVAGNLTLHGVTKPVTLNRTVGGRAKDRNDNQRVGFEASATLPRADFGVSFGTGLLGADVRIELQIQVVEKKS
jgi:polyisoprenoid-binding protein YceI